MTEGRKGDGLESAVNERFFAMQQILYSPLITARCIDALCTSLAELMMMKC